MPKQSDARGTLVAVVGPSGAGKDTVMRAVAERLATRAGSAEQSHGRAILFPRRVVTRTAAHDGEDCVLMTAAEFHAASAAGSFLLQWAAHGLNYGIPRSICDDLSAGHVVVVNLSRGVIAAAEAVSPRTSVVHITAAPAILAARIAARGRETVEEIRGRLAREAPLPDVRGGVVEIRNEGRIADAAAALLAHLDCLAAPVSIDHNRD